MSFDFWIIRLGGSRFVFSQRFPTYHISIFRRFSDKPRSLVPWPQIVTPYTETIKVEQGKMILLQFTYFAILVCGGTEACSCDHISVTDGHMTPLLDKACGFSTRAPSAHNFFQPTRIKSTSNIVNIFFSTDGSYSHAGWSLSWSVVTPGLETTRVFVSSMLFLNLLEILLTMMLLIFSRFEYECFPL